MGSPQGLSPCEHQIGELPHSAQVRWPPMRISAGHQHGEDLTAYMDDQLAVDNYGRLRRPPAGIHFPA